jgi:hypothetical protein
MFLLGFGRCISKTKTAGSTSRARKLTLVGRELNIALDGIILREAASDNRCRGLKGTQRSRESSKIWEKPWDDREELTRSKHHQGLKESNYISQ